MHKEIARFPFEGKDVTIFITDEYKRFNFIPENRNPELAEKSNAHSRQIELSIKAYGYLLSLIIVNTKWRIIDGQHRFAALRELKLPVYVMVIDGYNGQEVQALNTASKDWEKEDFAIYWSKKGKKPYTDLLELYYEFKMRIGTITTLLSSPESRKPAVFNHGEWKITKDLKTVRSHLILLMELAVIQPRITNRSSAEAFMQVASTPKYNQRRMRENLDSYGGKYWEKYDMKEEYLMMFTDLYNHARPEKNRLYFASDKDKAKVASARQKKRK
jgi:hypothetical protein